MTHPSLRKSAFLVEDNAVIRDNLIPAMEELAYVSVLGWCATERSAIDWLSAHHEKTDLVVLDLFLAEGSGIGVLSGLAQIGIKTSVVVLTNNPTADLQRRCKALGASAFFDKSAQTDEFFEFLRCR
jgi:DNA-binding NarL/FixJ family response regulator